MGKLCLSRNHGTVSVQQSTILIDLFCVYQEETNLSIENIKHIGTTNDIAIGGNPDKHYITVFMIGNVTPTSGSLVNMEPNKCEEWIWITWDELVSRCHTEPSSIFDPLLHFVNSGYTLPPYEE